jgi:hypothetical protein
MAKIEKLTPEQTAKFDFYVKKWLDIGLSTAECDFDKAVAAAKKCYTLKGLPEPKIFLGPFNSPYDSAVALALLHKWDGKKFKSNEELNKKLMAAVDEAVQSGKVPENLDFGSQIYGNHEYWLSYYDFFITECAVEGCEILEGLMEMSKVCGWWTPLANVCLFQHRPEQLHFDAENRIHNLNGPAIKYRGNSGKSDVYALHGIRVSEKVIKRQFTAADIDKESNVEVRRVMIDLYGQEKYLLDSKAEVVNVDDFGTLYSKDQSGDELLMMVKVVNSTPEEDGSFKDYFIRVDPKAYGGLKTAHAAVASTWRNRDGSMVFDRPERYDPEIQT